MITNETISKTIEAALEDGYEITVEDISKAVLARHYEDWTNITADEEYFGTPQMKWLANYLSDTVFDDNALSFEDNKKAYIELIEQTKRKAKMGEIEAKDALKIEADLRVKLNDKFSVQDDTKDKVVIVEPKYNMICRHGYECYLPTVEQLKEMYNLVEKDKQ